jgi:diaminopimelate epimerase
MKFVKMEGLGNDFIVTHGLTEEEFNSAVKKVSHLCDRRRGIGADGVIFIFPSATDEADYRMCFFNSNGEEAEMCGNGIRCFALYLNEMGLSDKEAFSIETLAGIIKTERKEDKIRVDMGAPVLSAEMIPTTKTEEQVVMEPIVVEDKEFHVTAVSMGNPHAVIFADSLTDELVHNYGSKLESHPFFPKRVNVEFVKVLSDGEIEMRVFERGCGETMACGTGACAAAVAGIMNKKHGNKITVHLLGGDLSIEWDGNIDHSVYMTGPANVVFKGECNVYQT